jgi:hypothetical protein
MHTIMMKVNLLLNIISFVLVALTRLRSIIKSNAPTFCNKAISSRFSGEVELLKSVKKHGWLVPTEPNINKTQREIVLFALIWAKS